MSETAFYAITLTIILIWFIFKKYSPVGVIAFSLYAAIGWFSYFAVKNGYIWKNITLVPYIFLIFCYLLYFWPLLKKNTQFNSKNISQESINENYWYYLIIYVVCAIIRLYIQLPTAINRYIAGSWATNYSAAVQNFDEVFTYSNRIEWFAIQITGYTGYLAIVLAFLYLRDQKHRKIAYLTIALYIMNAIVSSIYVSSRGTIFQLAFRIAILFVFVFTELQRKDKILLSVIGGLIGVFLVGYVTSITVSRFTNEGAFASVINYMGQAPIVFNDGIKKIDSYSMGGYTLGYLVGKVDTSVGIKAFNYGFFTFVGWMYIDWGPVGVILIGIIMNYIINKMISKDRYKLSDIVAIIFYVNFLVSGSLVIGSSKIIEIVMLILLIIVMRVFFEGKKYIIRH